MFWSQKVFKRSQNAWGSEMKLENIAPRVGSSAVSYSLRLDANE